MAKSWLASLLFLMLQHDEAVRARYEAKRSQPTAQLARALPSLHTDSESDLALLAPGSLLESLGPQDGDWTRAGEELKNAGELKYTIGRKLGEGAFGDVRLATAPSGNKFALKVIPASKMGPRIVNEVLNQKKVSVDAEGNLTPHESVVQVIEDFKIDGDVYIILEFFSGGELFKYIVRNGRIPEKKAKSIFKQVINGLEVCHERGVAHRDLKPENLLYDDALKYDEDAGTAKIIDFGLSADMVSGIEAELSRKAWRTSKLLTASCGSPNYAAPELLQSSPRYNGPPVDIWAMGNVLYAMLCARLAFDDPFIGDLFKKIKKGIHEPFCSSMSEDARDLVSKMLVVNPDKRITIREIKTHPFLVGPAPIDATPIDPAPIDLAPQKRMIDRIPRFRDLFGWFVKSSD